MARLKEIFKAADALGARHGWGTADWYFDRCESLKREDYLKVLKGMRDGDPEILDTFSNSPLSGEMADDLTPTKLWDELGVNEQQRQVAGDEICEKFEEAFSRSYAANVEQQCLTNLEHEVTFRITVNLVEQDAEQIASALENLLLGTFNTDIPDTEIEEDG